MRYLHSSGVREKRNNDQCIVFEYPLAHEKIDIARVEIRGRYPNEGFATNRESTELAYVLEGSGIVIIGNEEIILGAGDVVLIEPSEKFFWQGNMKLLLSCSPAWHPEQYEFLSNN